MDFYKSRVLIGFSTMDHGLFVIVHGWEKQQNKIQFRVYTKTIRQLEKQQNKIQFRVYTETIRQLGLVVYEQI